MISARVLSPGSKEDTGPSFSPVRDGITDLIMFATYLLFITLLAEYLHHSLEAGTDETRRVLGAFIESPC